MICPLCGYEFPAESAKTDCSDCPLHSCEGSGILCCPNCHYTFPTESKLVNLFKKIIKQKKESKEKSVIGKGTENYKSGIC